MFRVLTVCTANISRSPFAERALAHELDSDRFSVSSAGVMGFDGSGIDPAMANQARRFGIDVRGFQSRRLDQTILTSSDLVLTATRDHRSLVLEIEPSVVQRTFTINEVAFLVETMEPVAISDLVTNLAMRRHLVQGKDLALDIVDPIGGDYEMYASTAERIQSATSKVATFLNSLSD